MLVSGDSSHDLSFLTTNANSDKSKLQRFMLGGFSVATMYAPISFAATAGATVQPGGFQRLGNRPCLLQPRDAAPDQLVAMGGLLSINPTGSF